MSFDPNFGKMLKERILALGISPLVPVCGCTEDEIKQMMRVQGVTWLPDSYNQFLRSVGNGAGFFDQGARYSCKWLIKAKSLRKSLAEILFEEIGFVLPQNAFNFWDDGVATCWFYLTEGDDDPICYGYIYGLGGQTVQVGKRFSEGCFGSVDYIEQSRKKKQ